MKNKDLAYMEAGHAVAASLMRKGFGSVSLDPDRSLGRRLMQTSEVWSQPGNASQAEIRQARHEQATIYLAGAEALVRALGGSDAVRFSDEMEWIRANVHRMARRYDFMPMVEAVAGELVNRGTLTDEEIDAVIQDVRAELDVANMREFVSV